MVNRDNWCEQAKVERHNCAHCRMNNLVGPPPPKVKRIRIPDDLSVKWVGPTVTGDEAVACVVDVEHRLREPGFKGLTIRKYSETKFGKVPQKLTGKYNVVGYACEECTGLLPVASNHVAADRLRFQRRRAAGQLTYDSLLSEAERASDPMHYGRDH